MHTCLAPCCTTVQRTHYAAPAQTRRGAPSRASPRFIRSVRAYSTVTLLARLRGWSTSALLIVPMFGYRIFSKDIVQSAARHLVESHTKPPSTPQAITHSSSVRYVT